MTTEHPVGEEEQYDAAALMQAALLYLCQGKTTTTIELPMAVLCDVVGKEDLVMGVANREGIDFLILASQPKGKKI